MAWNVKLTATDDNTPLPDVQILEASTEGRTLATTDQSGTATVTYEVDTTVQNVFYVSPYRFSIQLRDGVKAIAVHDQWARERLIAKLPLTPGISKRWHLHYDITDASDGSPITGIPAIDPLTGTVLASNPSVTVNSPVSVEWGTCEMGGGTVVNESQIVVSNRCRQYSAWPRPRRPRR